MTNEEFLRAVLEERLRTRGEGGSFVRDLRNQLKSLEHFKKRAPEGTETFHIGARGEASEDLQPGEYQEDMYGNPIMSPEEKAEAEAEEEKRQQEEGVNQLDAQKFQGDVTAKVPPSAAKLPSNSQA